MRDGGWREKRVPNPRRALRKAEEGGVASGNIRFLPVPAAGTWRVSLLCTQLGGVCVCVLIIILAASVLNSLQKCRIGRECKAWKGRSRGERSSPASLLGESPSKGRERKERGRPCRSPPQPAKRGAMQICRSLPPPPLLPVSPLIAALEEVPGQTLSQRQLLVSCSFISSLLHSAG